MAEFSFSAISQVNCFNIKITWCDLDTQHECTAWELGYHYSLFESGVQGQSWTTGGFSSVKEHGTNHVKV